MPLSSVCCFGSSREIAAGVLHCAFLINVGNIGMTSADEHVLVIRGGVAFVAGSVRNSFHFGLPVRRDEGKECVS